MLGRWCLRIMKITIEELEFPINIKNKLLKLKDITKLHIDFINGKNIVFNKTNLKIQEPHKIVISNKTSSVVILSYENDEHLYTTNLNIITSSQVSTVISKLLNY